MSEEAASILLPIFLGATVPLSIQNIIESGGITQEHLNYAKQYADLLAGPPCEDLMYKPSRKKDKGKSAEMFNALTRTLAIAAFQPGGIDFLGLHFEASMPSVKEATRAD